MLPLLRTLWREPRAPRAPRRTRWDWLLVALVVPGAVLEALLRPDVPWRWLSLVLTLALAPLLLLRRRAPLLVLAAAVAVGAVAEVATGGGLPEALAQAPLVVLPYALFRWASGREVLAGAVLLLLASATHVLLSGSPAATAGEAAGNAVGGSAVLVAVAALGLTFRFRARARSRELERAVLLERERLARDLHDTVAHHVSAIAVRAQAGLAAAAARPEAAAEVAVAALRVVEAEASTALTDMRSLVRTLRRNGTAELGPAPGLRELRGLADGTTAGPRVVVEVAAACEDLPEALQAGLYRIAQESVTNARRHARGATRIDVRVSAREDEVLLQVSDDGGAARRRAAAGFGLAGMAERAALLGGTCTAGPDPAGGWTVTASLPRPRRDA
ncbi:signal transduction histidine kinase [Kineococcus xinjiangensis]|uniref:histidine kinase n=1 Tax=Kineococcus xinjiangensis TaxID=512762 RepID=A0A2S6IPG9_9ACTN|nr:histidine kinase [Kineococcus xinjiangensis]PPK96154.1 signal transduction histidine kinase [Kineococcus xinjiangensis]